MQAYSLDLRQRVVRAYEQGQDSLAEIAARFGVGPTFVKKMLRQKRETDDLAPRPHGGGKPASLNQKQRRILQQKVEREQDISLVELQTYLQEKAQVEVHLSTISRALKAMDLPRKKKA
jgi:transposase